MNRNQTMAHSIQSTGLADVLERVLDKGLVIAGDIKIKLLELDLLTIQIRLLVASVEKAQEMGMNWWITNPDFSPRAKLAPAEGEVAELRQRLQDLEARVAANADKVARVVKRLHRFLDRVEIETRHVQRKQITAFLRGLDMEKVALHKAAVLEVCPQERQCIVQVIGKNRWIGR